MDSANLNKFQQVLSTKRDELRRSLDRTNQERKESHDYGGDEADRANASQSKEMSLRQKETDRGLLLLVEAALSRINDGSFGECLNCGQQITLNRLNAVPWSRYCITCQELIMERR